HQAARKQQGAEWIKADGIGDVSLPHVRERARAAAEGAGMAGQVIEGTRREGQVPRCDDPVDPRVGEPEDEPAEQGEIANSIAYGGPGDGDWKSGREAWAGAQHR